MKRILLVVLALLPLPAAGLSEREALDLFNRAAREAPQRLPKLQKAAESGDAAAQFQFGRAYSHGASVQRNDATAARWVEKAAEQGHLEAQSNIGYLYSAGLGVPRDNDKAMAWWTRAAESGFLQAQFNLSIAYLQGKLTAKDDAKAFTWMGKAAAQGNAVAQCAARRLPPARCRHRAEHERGGALVSQGGRAGRQHRGIQSRGHA